MSNKIRTASYKERLKTAKLPERSVPVCLRGDLYAEVERLDRRLRELGQGKENDGDDRFVGNVEAVRLAEEIDTIRGEMAEETDDFIIRALPRGKWTALAAEHPPRTGDDTSDQIKMLDQRMGVNYESFSDALLRISVISPELDDDDWETLLTDTLVDSQYEELVEAAWAVNRTKVSVPFSSAASKIRTSGSE